MASIPQSPSQSSHGEPSANNAQNPGPESPYYIHPSETFESFKPTLVLSGPDNHSKWYREMNVALASKKKLGFVNGTIAVPAKDDPMYGPWERCNNLVRSWIVKAVSPEIEKSVHGMVKAVDVWRDLKKRFSDRDRFIILDIWADIRSLRQGKGSVASYFTEFSLLWSQLEILDPQPACTCVAACSCGAMDRVKEREGEKLDLFLNGLDERFDAAKLRIKKESPLPSIDKVFAWVVHEERQMVSQDLMQYQSPPPSSASILAIPESQLGKDVTRTEKLVLSVHEHELTLTSPPLPPKEPYTCNGCGELGFGRSYCCDMCKYFLHEDCAHAVRDESSVRHPLFKEGDLSFLKEPPGQPRHCDACRKQVKGFVYHRPDSTGHVNDTGLDVHPCCLKLKESVTYADGDVQITLKLSQKISGKCEKCNREKFKDDNAVRGWAYESSDGEYRFHVSCFKELIIAQRKEGYFSKQGKEIVKVEECPRGSGAMKTVTKIASVVFQAMFVAIFGDPVTFVLTLVQALAGIFIT